MHWTTHTTFLTWFWLVLNYFCTFTYRSRKFSPEGVWEIILFFFFTGPRGLFSVILLCEIIKFEFFQICACCISLISIFFFFYIYTGQKIVWWIPSQAMTGRPNMEFVYFYFFLLIVETWELEVANYVRGCKLCFKMFWSSSVLRISKYVYKCRYDYFNNQRVQGNLS